MSAGVLLVISKTADVIGASPVDPSKFTYKAWR